VAWVKGGPGRPPGGRNQSSMAKAGDAKRYCDAIINDPQYRANLMNRARAGTLPPQIEALLFYFSFGKPTERVEVTAPELTRGLNELTEAELAARTEALMVRIQNLKALPPSNEAVLEGQLLEPDYDKYPISFPEGTSEGAGDVPAAAADPPKEPVGG
jgi:hypothetical protein